MISIEERVPSGRGLYMFVKAGSEIWTRSRDRDGDRDKVEPS